MIYRKIPVRKPDPNYFLLPPGSLTFDVSNALVFVGTLRQQSRVYTLCACCLVILTLQSPLRVLLCNNNVAIDCKIAGDEVRRK